MIETENKVTQDTQEREIRIKCPRCHGATSKMNFSINGVYEYYECNRATCAINFPVRVKKREGN